MNKIIKIAENFRKDLLQKKTKYERNVASVLSELGIKFIEQQIFYYKYSFYIVDFYLPEYKIVIEVDGRQHRIRENRIKDYKRTQHLKWLGVKEVIRIDNSLCDKKFLRRLLTKKILK